MIMDNTPILVGVGQCVVRETPAGAQLPSPMDLLEQAARAALADSGAGPALTAALDTVAVMRFFEHSTRGEAMVAHPFGCADNVPGALANRINARPQDLIYAEVGGQTPQRLVNRYCAAIARGYSKAVLLVGAEAIASIKQALRANLSPAWDEPVGGEYRDEWTTDKLTTPYERAHGLNLPLRVYPLFEHAARIQAGRSLAQHRTYMGEVLAPFAAVAAGNPFAQFPLGRSAPEIATPSAENFLISEPYTKWMVAQDAVNQGAAVVLTSAGYARELGIPPAHWVTLTSHADLDEHTVTARPDLARSEAQALALAHCLDAAGLTIADIAHLDLYSCFPIAVTSACEALGLPTTGGRALTLTGGLPFFGGPGNNYSMHAIVEAVARIRAAPGTLAMVVANGGYLSKHSMGIYGAPGDEIWQPTPAGDLEQRFKALPTIALAPMDCPEARVESWVLTLRKGQPEVAYVAARAGEGRLLAKPAEDDASILPSFTQREPVGRRIAVSHDGQCHRFKFKD